MASNGRARIVEWIVLLVPLGGVLVMGWLVARHTCAPDLPSPGDVAAQGEQSAAQPDQ